ncbi:substrate-binding domain-containing protein [Puia sp.]|jgi:phosphate transport system substrate-binding protein|uniref:PstS family phosphate ABC transporter substrate-binding protein n=1 Tax=Puia sp. TaxID=2045100 RepID=UPI002F3EDA39
MIGIGKGILTGFVVCTLLGGCASKAPKTAQETPTNGTIHISVDESFRPVIDSQIKVFESSFPNVHIIADYRSEAQCLRDLTTDSTRMVLVTRGLTPEEGNFYNDSFHLRPTFGVLAFDAIAVIVNKASKDSVFEMQDLKDMLSGADTKHLPVMDGVSATSTVRYAMDSILGGKPLGKTVTAARSSEGVVNYVANNPRAVGFIGAGWIADRNDPGDTSFNKNVIVAAIRCKNCLGATYVRPYQANIALQRYPLVRSLYYILKENFSGVGNNFVNFLQYERGQLIFSKAYLWPAGMHFELRDVQLSK